MPLPQILRPPETPRGWDEWTFAHLSHHQAIITAVHQAGKGTLQLYQIFPFNWRDTNDWLLQHQSMHSQMNAIFNINGSDLSVVDFQDRRQVDAWLQLHYLEHQQVAASCGLPI